MRTKFPAKVVNFKSKDQREKFLRLAHQNACRSPKQQQLKFIRQERKTGEIILHNFFVKDRDGRRVWAGYEVIIDRRGLVHFKKDFKTARTETGELVLRPANLDIAI